MKNYQKLVLASIVFSTACLAQPNSDSRAHITELNKDYTLTLTPLHDGVFWIGSGPSVSGKCPIAGTDPTAGCEGYSYVGGCSVNVSGPSAPPTGQQAAFYYAPDLGVGVQPVNNNEAFNLKQPMKIASGLVPSKQIDIKFLSLYSGDNTVKVTCRLTSRTAPTPK